MYDLSIKSLERAIELKSDDYNVYYYLGISYAYKGKLDKKFNTKALDNYLKALKLKPNNSEINYSISVLYYYNLGNRKKGLEYMLEAFKYSDKEHKIPAVLGKYYFDEKSYDSSISYYKIALNKATNNTNKADYCGYISKIYKTMKKFGLAEEYLKKARKYNSNYKLKINE
jgi:tetratricopeptide (TPR) repeat protein